MASKDSMQVVDVREWSADVKSTLERVAASGGGRLVLDRENEVVVLSVDLWNLIHRHLPSVLGVIEDARSED